MNKMQSSICLLAVTLCWSSEVILFAALPEDINPLAFTCVTSLIAAALLILCFGGRIRAAFMRDRGSIEKRLVLLAALNTSYNVMYNAGLDYFDVSSGAFTLSMTAVVLPVILLVSKRGVNPKTWISAVCVLIGIVAAIAPSWHTSQVSGIAVLIVGCILRAIFIVKLNDYAREHDPVAIAAGMTCLNSILAFIPWNFVQPGTFLALPWSNTFIAVAVIYSYFIVAFATVLNIFAQRHATPAQATIIYATEIIFSIIWATLLPAGIVDHVDISLPIIAGCTLVVVGNLIEIAPFMERSSKHAHALPDDVVVTPTQGDFAATPTHGDASVDLHHSEAAATLPQSDPVSTLPQSDAAIDLPQSDPVAALLSRFKSPVLRKLVLFAVLLAVYLIVSLPFKVLAVIPGFTDIRPVNMLMPVYGIFFGIPGCLVFGIGNLISDIAADELRWTSIAGFISNVAYPYVLYLFYVRLRKKPFSLRTGKDIVLFVVAVTACGIMELLILAPAVHAVYPEVDIWLFSVSVLFNSIAFPVALAIPLIILIQEGLGFVPLFKPNNKGRSIEQHNNELHNDERHNNEASSG